MLCNSMAGNGGFLASLLAVRQRPWLAAVAPQSGYAYDGYDSAALARDPRRIPILMHHSRDDDYVNPAGCCAGGGPCCCGIGVGRPRGTGCVPFWEGATSAFEQWRRIYGTCSGNNDGALPVVTEHELAPSPSLAATCRTFSGCAGGAAGRHDTTTRATSTAGVNVTACLWRLSGGGGSTLHHTEWARPAEPDALTGVFFAREACEKHGSWRADGTCACLGGWGSAHCLTKCSSGADASSDAASAAAVGAHGTIQQVVVAETATQA